MLLRLWEQDHGTALISIIPPGTCATLVTTFGPFASLIDRRVNRRATTQCRVPFGLGYIIFDPPFDRHSAADD